MTIINPKSITGVTSITTASGADNLLTVHTNNTTERVRINNDGDVIVGSGITVSPDGDIFATGVSTVTTLKVGSGVTVSSDGDIFATGVCTATSFVGDGSALTGITQTTINSNADNRLITGSGTANTLNGESALTFDGATLDIDGGSNDTPLILDTSATAGAHLRFRKDGSNVHFVGAGGGFSLGDAEDLSLRGYDNILFATGNSSTERARITSDGKIGIGLDSPNCLLHIQDAAISGYGSQSSTLLVLEDTGDTSVEIASGHNNTGSIFFGDTGASNKGQINYLHGTGGDAMSFHANGSERMRINSDGDVTISDGDLVIGTSGHGIDFSATANAGNSATVSNELFDDYEEGTWVPTSRDGTLSYERANYTKVGRLVHLVAYLYNFSDNSTNDSITIQGIPFSQAVGDVTVGSVMYSNVSDANRTVVHINNARNGFIFYGGDTGGYDQARYNELSGSSSFYMVATYIAS